MTNVCVPLVFHRSTAGPPYSLRLQIWDDHKRYQAIEVAEILIEYADGEIVRNTDGWSRSLKPYTQYNVSSSGVVGTEMLMLSDQIPDLITRHADVKITLKGRIQTVTGERMPFLATATFEAKSRSRVSTWWAEIVKAIVSV